MRKKKNHQQTFEFSDFPGMEIYFNLSLIGLYYIFFFLAGAASSIWGLLLSIRKKEKKKLKKGFLTVSFFLARAHSIKNNAEIFYLPPQKDKINLAAPSVEMQGPCPSPCYSILHLHGAGYQLPKKKKKRIL